MRGRGDETCHGTNVLIATKLQWCTLGFNNMVKSIIILGFLMSAALLPTDAQKSSYATRPVGTAQVLPQYQMNLGNRLGEGSTTESPPKPTDATTLQDLLLLQLVASWPKDKQPFWFLNSGYIKNQREQSALSSEQDSLPPSTVMPSMNPPTLRVRSFRGRY